MRHFQAEIILLCVRWYLRYALSYRESSRNGDRTRAERRSHDHLSLRYNAMLLSLIEQDHLLTQTADEAWNGFFSPLRQRGERSKDSR
jgi:hypothetical protein